MNDEYKFPDESQNSIEVEDDGVEIEIVENEKPSHSKLREE